MEKERGHSRRTASKRPSKIQLPFLLEKEGEK
jgi:hypothetical protein